jgi:hypothetical protein
MSRSEEISSPFLTSAIDGGELLPSWAISLPLGKTPDTIWMGSLVGSRAGVDFLEKTIISFPCR